jgi:hypothetical protein
VRASPRISGSLPAFASAIKYAALLTGQGKPLSLDRFQAVAFFVG